jgi:hypothetical protein
VSAPNGSTVATAPSVRTAARPWLLAGLLAAWGVTVLVAGAAPATAAQRLSVSPAIIERELRPGQVITEQVTVRSDGSDGVRVRFEHADMGFDEQYQPQFIEDERELTVPFSTRGWFSVPQAEYSIAAGKEVRVPLRIEVPRNATPGTHLGAAFFRTVADASTAGGGAAVVASARTGPIVIIALQGGSDPEPDLQRFRAPELAGHGLVRPTVELANTGEQHFFARGKVTMAGRGRSWTQQLPRKLVVPGQPRRLVGEDDAPIQVGAKGAPMGRYQLSVEVLTEPGNVRVRQQRVVWVIPVWARITGGALVLAVLVGIALLVAKAWRARG